MTYSANRHRHRSPGRWVVALTLTAVSGWVVWQDGTAAERPVEPTTHAPQLPMVAVDPVQNVDAARRTTERIAVVGSDSARKSIQLCQALGPAAPYPIWGVDSAASGGCGEYGWDARGMIPWQQFAQGEYVGSYRSPHVSEYRMRPGDRVAFVYRRTRRVLGRPYELQTGDRILVESLTAGRGGVTQNQQDTAQDTEDNINRQLLIQPDGTIVMPLIGRVRAAGRTLESLQDELDVRYKSYFREPSITVTPLEVDTRLADLLESVDARFGVGGLQFDVTILPSGTVMLPAIGEFSLQGLTMAEAKLEVDSRYDQVVPGVEVTPIVIERAQRFVYVLGEVAQPGRFVLEGPTTSMQSIALAGGWNTGANLRQVVVFRRGPDWRLMATMIDLRGALYGRRPVPADEIWLNDSDIVLVPKSPIQVMDELIEQLFTRGLYRAVPVDVIWGISNNSVL